MGLTDLTTDQLRRAVALKEQIESLEQQLGSLLNGHGGPGRRGGPRGRRTMSPAARARIAAAQRARWARQKAGSKGPGKRRRMSAAARARIAAAQRARWARVRGGG